MVLSDLKILFQVNIIPLISKADTLTPDECHEFKREILREIELHKINIYQFPDGADDEEMRLAKKLRERIPFAVIGSNAVLPWLKIKKTWFRRSSFETHFAKILF